MRRVLVHEELCMGCGLCEVYCTVQHSKSKDPVKAYRKESPKPVSRVKLVQERPVSFAIRCRNCEDAPCVQACLTGARSIAEDGQVVHDDEKCMGCLTCVMVCPWGAVWVDPYRHKAVVKCDLCPGRETPACVENCPNNALTVEEVVTVEEIQQ